jgi:hypothetical protein
MTQQHDGNSAAAEKESAAARPKVWQFGYTLVIHSTL